MQFPSIKRVLLAKNSKKFLVLNLLIILGSFFYANSVFAAKVVHESFLKTEAFKRTFNGAIEGEQLGADLIAGDFNHDEIQDIVIASPFASLEGKQWNGGIRIVLGNKGMDSLGENDLDIFNFYGENSGDQLGTSLAVGDFNDDSIDDLAIGAHNAQFEGKRPGKVYIVYGYKDMTSQTSGQGSSQMLERMSSRQAVFGLDKADFELVGKSTGDGFGLALASDDINKDGIDDLVIGAPSATVSKKSKAGAVYVYLGTKSGFASVPSIFIYGQNANERFGSALAIGNVHSLDKADILVGAYNSSEKGAIQSGKVYLYREVNGTDSYLNTPSMIFKGSKEKEWFGFSVDTGDLDGDNYHDIAITSFPYKGDKQNAQVSIFKGGSALDYNNPNTVIGKANGQALIGAEVKLEDLNGDKRSDILTGAPAVSFNKAIEEGELYLIYSDNEYKDLRSLENSDFDAVIHGENVDDWFGGSLEVLDLNGDGYQDIAAGARYADNIDAINSGKVFILWGDGQSFGKVKLLELGLDSKVSRGELVQLVLNSFDIKNRKADLIESCYENREFCLFNFTAISSYNDIQLEPELVLYPDVMPENEFHEDINIATMLSLVNGYLNEKDTPFHPEFSVTRIQALKVILSASELVPYLHQFELANLLGSEDNIAKQSSIFNDVSAKIASRWWYARYVNFAVQNGIIDESELFRPDENITIEELNDMINRTLEYLRKIQENEKVKS